MSDRDQQRKAEGEKLLNIQSEDEFDDEQSQFTIENESDIERAEDFDASQESRNSAFSFFPFSYAQPNSNHSQKPSVFSVFSRKILFLQLFSFLVLSTLVLCLFVIQPSETLVSFSPTDDNDEDYTKSLVPEQIHFSLGRDQSSRIVVWATWSHDTTKPVVRYGLDPGHLNLTQKGKVDSYKTKNYTSPLFHYVQLPKLRHNITYYYQCGDSALDIWSQAYPFYMPPTPPGPFTVGCIGDLGQTNNSHKTIDGVFTHPNIHLILMPGDLSYADGNQSRWDRWANLHQDYSVSVPWTFAPGNHENEKENGFLAYNKRFLIGPGIDSPGGNLYYSFVFNWVHFIMLSSESDYEKGSPQYNWLKSELKKVDRKLTPWLVISWHRPWYSSNADHQGSAEDMRADMEELFHQYSVDLCLTGHVHAYERTVRMYRNTTSSTGPYYITFGNGGNYQGASLPWIEPEPDWSAYRTTDIGYSLLQVFNTTHMLWQMYKNDGNVLADELWITKPKKSRDFEQEQEQHF